MENNRYSLSFTTGSLFHHESVMLADLYLDLKGWNAVRDRCLSDNLLQARTLRTSKNICREIISRLKQLCLPELDLLVHTDSQTQGYILWLAVCRRYQFIADFAVEVLRERFISLKNDLQYEDFDAFFNQKAEWHAELEKTHPVTKTKLRQVLFRILREADLLSAENTINAAVLSPRLLAVIPPGNHRDVLFFPLFEAGVGGVRK